MEKFTLILNSHSLTKFQKCNAAYAYSELIQIEPVVKRAAFVKGTQIGRILNALHYLLKRYKPTTAKQAYEVCLPVLKKVNLEKRFKKYFGFMEMHQYIDLIEKYIQTYKLTDTHVVSVETGFSKIIYEDHENLFIYEGKPDTIFRNQNGDLVVSDNKTQASKYSIYQFNNQVLGYLWATNCQDFFYNFLTLTKTPDFRRECFRFSKSQVSAWKAETIRWYFKIKEAHESKEFLMNRSACQDKYGICEFADVCEAPTEQSRNYVIEKQFKQAARHKSW